MEKIINSLKNKTIYDFLDSILKGITKTIATLFIILLPFKNACLLCYVASVIEQSLKILEENAQFINILILELQTIVKKNMSKIYTF